jgi:thimet oligopeptidase
MHRVVICLFLLGAVPAAAAQTADPATLLQSTLLTPADATAVDRMCDERLTAAGRLRTRFEALPAQTPPRAFARALDDLLMLLNNTQHGEVAVLRRVHPDAAVRKAAERCSERAGAATDDLQLSRPAYERLLRARGVRGADYWIERQIAAYRRGGVDRDEATRRRAAELRAEITRLGNEFERNFSSDTRTVSLPAAAGEGLPQPWIDAHRQPDGSFKISGGEADAFPVFRFSRDAEARRRAMTLLFSLGHEANRRTLPLMLAKRAELARLLGYPDYATLDLEPRMARTPAAAEALLERTAGAARARAQADMDRILAELRRHEPQRTQVNLWDLPYGRAAVRAADHQIDPATLRRYFRFERVRDGVFGLAQDLYGISIRRGTRPVWAEGVTAHEILHKGHVIGRFYLDLHAREGKLPFGAWAVYHRSGVAGRTVPEATLVMNMPREHVDHPEVATLLHEFGHLLHHIFAGQGEWHSGGAFALESDAQEAPSQMMEEWAYDYETLRRFAVDDEGRPIPADLVRRLQQARPFGRGLGELNDLAQAAVSLDFHREPPTSADIDARYERSLARFSPLAEPPGAHGWSSFNHLRGYASTYYTYAWSRALAEDLFSRFRTAGLRDPAVARAYRREILAPGGTRSMNDLAQAFLGRPWSADAFIARLREGH